MDSVEFVSHLTLVKRDSRRAVGIEASPAIAQHLRAQHVFDGGLRTLRWESATTFHLTIEGAESTEPGAIGVWCLCFCVVIEMGFKNCNKLTFENK